jgi:hypothetical protein
MERKKIASTINVEDAGTGSFIRDRPLLLEISG